MAYNLAVPTPFYHLSIAETLLEHLDLPSSAGTLLRSEASAFYLGNTAPDVQTISGQARTATHFFDLPLRESDPLPWEQLLQRYPQLVYSQHMPPSQAAFVAGYICHLLADWLWVKDIFVPVFGLQSRWDTFPQRLYLHNVLRSYLDFQIYPQLHPGFDREMASAAPSRWLPFVQDRFLVRWRDELVVQLVPGAPVRTVEIFAARQGIPPEEYNQLIASKERMDQEVFAHLPHGSLERYRRRLIQESMQLVQVYLNHPARIPIDRLSGHQSFQPDVR